MWSLRDLKDSILGHLWVFTSDAPMRYKGSQATKCYAAQTYEIAKQVLVGEILTQHYDGF